MRANLALTQKKFVNELTAVDATDKEELDVEYDGLCAQVVRHRSMVKLIRLPFNVSSLITLSFLSSMAG